MEHEDYRWVAEYEDGDVLQESEDVRFASVDKERLRCLHLVPQKDESLPSAVLMLPNGSEPVFFRRKHRIIRVDEHGMEQEAGEQVITCIGWKRVIGEEEVGSYTFYFYDGSTVVSDELNCV